MPPRPEQLECRTTPSVYADFNGDGYDDLAIGSPSDNPGFVNVLYGSPAGLSVNAVLPSQVWTPANTGASAAGYVASFGTELAPGDFNGDGHGDLAIGFEYSELDDFGVVVLFGSPTGLSAVGSQFLSEASFWRVTGGGGVKDWGPSIAAGNFNGDAYVDLAIGEPADALNDVGVVYVVPGSAAGLDTAAAQTWRESFLGDDELAEDQFGRVLCAGNFNGDLYDDLAIGVPLESLGKFEKAGMVHVLYGTSAGLQKAGAQIWTQNSPGIADHGESYDLFGSALASGDFNGNGKDDLAIGVASEDLAGHKDAGAVHVLYGVASGLTRRGSRFFTQDSDQVADQVEKNDHFGALLAAGDFNADGRDDLAISAYGESLGKAAHAGAVHVLYGAARGLSAAGNQFWRQGRSAFEYLHGHAETSDELGRGLAAGDFNGDGRADLAIGVNREDNWQGAVHVVHGHSKGLRRIGSQYWTVATFGVEGPEFQFGYVLA